MFDNITKYEVKLATDVDSNNEVVKTTTYKLETNNIYEPLANYVLHILSSIIKIIWNQLLCYYLNKL